MRSFHLAAALFAALVAIAPVAAQTPTTTTIISDNPDPSVVGQGITVAFTVNGNPSHTVTVTDDLSGAMCSASVAVGSCILTLLTTGLHTLTASYPGGGGFDPSSDTETHAVSVTIVVNTNVDDVTANGTCTLREAVRAANTNAPVDACPAGSATIVDVINLGPGTYILNIAGTDDAALLGDLDITGDTRIVGLMEGSTFIRQNTTDRVFQILTGSVELRDLTVRGGRHATGGGIHNAGTLTINSATVDLNTARTSGGGASRGGGIYNSGVLTLSNSSVNSNAVATGVSGTSRGGAIYNDGGTLTLNSCTVTGNTAVSGAFGTSQGGGIYTIGSTTLNSSTPSGNTVTAGAGGTAQGPNTYP